MPCQGRLWRWAWQSKLCSKGRLSHPLGEYAEWNRTPATGLPSWQYSPWLPRHCQGTQFQSMMLQRWELCPPVPHRWQSGCGEKWAKTQFCHFLGIFGSLDLVINLQFPIRGKTQMGWSLVYGLGATSWPLKVSKEPASATWAGSSFHSGTVRNTNWCHIGEPEFRAAGRLYCNRFPGRELGTRSISPGSTASRPLRILYRMESRWCRRRSASGSQPSSRWRAETLQASNLLLPFAQREARFWTWSRRAASALVCGSHMVSQYSTAISTMIMPNEKIRGEYIALITFKKPWDCVKTQRLCTCFPYYRGPRMSPMPWRGSSADCLHHLLNAYFLYQRALFGTVERTKKRQRASVYSIRTAAWRATSIDQIRFFNNKNPYWINRSRSAKTYAWLPSPLIVRLVINRLVWTVS